MKFLAFVIACSVLSISLAQYENQPTPLPVPMSSVNLTKIQGTWFTTMVYDYGYNNTNPSGILCALINYTYNPSTNQINYYRKVASPEFNNTMDGSFSLVNNSTSQWEDDYTGATFDWLEIDPINSNWALLASPTNQAAQVISRSPQLSPIVVQAVKTLLSLENYAINTTNYFVVNNEC